MLYEVITFTRMEAMIVPYALYNLTSKKVGVIADDSLFETYFGTFLRNLGAMRKSEPNRDQIIFNVITSYSIHYTKLYDLN